MRLASPLLALLCLASTATASADWQRGVPRALRAALVGCWEAWPGERWTITAEGPTGLRADLRFEAAPLRARFRVRGRPRRYGESIRYRTDDGSLRGPCGPTTQHGQFCVLRWDEGDLRVARYGLGAGPRHRQGRLHEVVTARRCHAP